MQPSQTLVRLPDPEDGETGSPSETLDPSVFLREDPPDCGKDREVGWGLSAVSWGCALQGLIQQRTKCILYETH